VLIVAGNNIYLSVCTWRL